MNESIQGVFVIVFMSWLVSMLYVGPTYYRRLGSLIEHVRNEHADLYESLGKPNMSMLDTSIRGQVGILRFILRKEYLSLEDQVTTDLSKQARWRLAFNVTGFFLITMGMLLGVFN